jgi:glycosyltransferase involved in cell wall biosynthesis
LASHFASADIFIFPSTSETFGNVVIEAMASGLVTVAYDYAAARLHLRHQVNGLTARVDDEPAYLAACIHALDQTRWREWRDEARHTASGLTWSSVVTRFENDLLEILGR